VKVIVDNVLIERARLWPALKTAAWLKCMLNNCLQWFKARLRTLTTAVRCLTRLFHDCAPMSSITRYQWSVTWSVRHASLLMCV